MAGTIVVDRLESDASYASSINVASPMVISNTITMGSSAAISGNVIFDTNTLVIDSVENRVRIGGTDFTPTANQSSPAFKLEVHGNMRLGNGSDAEQDIHFHGSSNSVWQVGTNNAGPSSTNWFYIFRNGTGYTLNVDNAGRVTMPYQPAFYARLTSGNISGAQTILFNSVLTNVGSHYNSSTGRFTAPIAGLYEFHFTGLNNGGGNRMQAEIRINNGGYTSMEQGASYGYQMGSMVLLFSLAANDYVTVNLSGASDAMYGSGYNSFSGRLVG